ncbi:MAG: hypothetical protein U0359_16100 [Byssovorax sp.]
MRPSRALLSGAVLSLAAIAGDRALADTGSATPVPAAQTKASPRIHDLPDIALPDLVVPPVPDRLSPKEHAPGFWAGHPEHPAAARASRGGRSRGALRDEPPSMVLVSTSEAMAKQMFGGPTTERDAEGDAGPACFTFTSGLRETAGDRAQWNGSTTTVATLPAWATAPDQFGRMRLVRAERLLHAGGPRATLSVSHAWVDTESLGTRLVDQRQIPLAEVLSGPGGMRVFAARSGADVLFVLKPPAQTPDRGFVMPLMFTGADGMNGSSQCGSVSIRLRAARAGDAELAMVTGEIAAPVEDGDGPPTFGREHQVRAFRLTLSESLLSLDPEPILSVSFGWTGKAHTELR